MGTTNSPLAELRAVLLLSILIWVAESLPALAQTAAHTPTQQASDASASSAALHGGLVSTLTSVQGLHAEPPIVGETAERPNFTREMIQVQWRSGDPIDLYVIRPRGIAKPKPVIYLYGYPSETTRFQDDKYCERLTASGFAAIGFVSSMTGQRYHDRPMKEWFVSELPESLTTSVQDVRMILNYLAGRGDFDLGEVGMFGQGSGATIAILSASADARLRVLDLLDPWGNWPEWLAKSSLVPEIERSTYLKPDFLARVAPLDPVKLLPELKSQKIRLQVVNDDPVTPAIAVDRIASAAPKASEVVRYTTTRELYSASGDGRLFEWIKDQITSLGRAANGSGNTAVLQEASDSKSTRR